MSNKVLSKRKAPNTPTHPPPCACYSQLPILLVGLVGASSLAGATCSRVSPILLLQRLPRPFGFLSVAHSVPLLVASTSITAAAAFIRPSIVAADEPTTTGNVSEDGAKRGPKPKLTLAKKKTIARSAMALKPKGIEPSVAAVIENCPESLDQHRLPSLCSSSPLGLCVSAALSEHGGNTKAARWPGSGHTALWVRGTLPPPFVAAPGGRRGGRGGHCRRDRPPPMEQYGTTM